MGIAAIEVKLVAWGEWSVKRECNGLGFKSTSLTRLMGVPGGASDGLPHDVDDEMLAVDRVVCSLPAYLKDTMVEVYQKGGLMKEHAARLGVGVRALQLRIDGAHTLIRNRLWDREFEKKNRDGIALTSR